MNFWQRAVGYFILTLALFMLIVLGLGLYEGEFKVVAQAFGEAASIALIASALHDVTPKCKELWTWYRERKKS